MHTDIFLVGRYPEPDLDLNLNPKPLKSSGAFGIADMSYDPGGKSWALLDNSQPEHMALLYPTSKAGLRLRV